MDRVLVKVFFPQIDKWYEIWIPMNKTIYNIIQSMSKGVDDLNEGVYKHSNSLILYNRKTGEYYDMNAIPRETDIKNGTELILI